MQVHAGARVAAAAAQQQRQAAQRRHTVQLHAWLRTRVALQLRHLGIHALAVGDLVEQQRVRRDGCAAASSHCSRRRGPAAGGRRRGHFDALVLAHQLLQLQPRQRRGGLRSGHGGARRHLPEPHKHDVWHNAPLLLPAAAAALRPAPKLEGEGFGRSLRRHGQPSCCGSGERAWRIGNSARGRLRVPPAQLPGGGCRGSWGAAAGRRAAATGLGIPPPTCQQQRQAPLQVPVARTLRHGAPLPQPSDSELLCYPLIHSARKAAPVRREAGRGATSAAVAQTRPVLVV